METYLLACHPDMPASTVESITVHAERTGQKFWLRYHMECELEALVLPGSLEPERRDGLWRSTCFEAFIGGASYSEFNFAPSGQWAAYHFDAYRENMTVQAVATAPDIMLDVSEGHFALEVTILLDGLGPRLALAAVIEETDGTKSYWALAHPPGKPDFHHPTCFAATLPPPSAP